MTTKPFTTDMSAEAHAAGRPRPSVTGVLLRWRYRNIWGATVAIFVVSALVAPRSLGSNSTTAMLSFAAVLIIVSAGQTLVMQQGGIDLSVPGTVTLCSMVPPLFLDKTGGPLWVALVVTVLVGAVIGVVNGLAVTRFGITPLIATLAVNSILLGALLTYSGGLPSVNSPSALVSFASARLLHLPVIFLVSLGVAVLIGLAVGTTVTGRRFVAVGVSPPTARASGVPTDRYVMGAYVACSLTGSFGGIMLLGYLQAASLSIGNEYLFTSIAAVVLGGTSLAGGRGSVIASAVGALFLTQLVQLLLTVGAPSSVQLLCEALAIGVAVALRTMMTDRSRPSMRGGPARLLVRPGRSPNGRLEDGTR